MGKSVFLFPWKISNPAPLRNHRPGTSTTDQQATWSLAANWLLDRNGLLEKNSIVIISKICSSVFSFIKGKALQCVLNFQGAGPVGISLESALLTCLGLVLGNGHVGSKARTL